MHDVVIIGAGIAGATLARELSRYQLDICVLEAGYDVACGASRTNSGIVHGGYDPIPGTQKAHFNVAGAKLIPTLSAELGFRYKNNGSMVLASSDEEVASVHTLFERAHANGVEHVELLSAEKSLQLEPSINPDTKLALVCHNSGIVDPFGMVVAFAENACTNGVTFRFLCPVTTLVHDSDAWDLTLASGEHVRTRCVINCAGAAAMALHEQMCGEPLEARPVKGEYVLMSRDMGPTFTHTIFRSPGPMGKGVLVSPTVEGNLIVGPDAVQVPDATQTQTTSDGQEWLAQQVCRSWPGYTPREIIARFAGIRPSGADGDFVVGKLEGVPAAFEVAAFDSPGLTSAPAVAAELAPQVAELLGAALKHDFVPERAMPPRLIEMSAAERAALVAQDSRYAHIVCRCEQVSEAEILQAMSGPLPAYTITGIKRRCRAGTGRCQGGFCAPLVAEIIARETHRPIETVCEAGPGSEIAPLFHGRL